MKQDRTAEVIGMAHSQLTEARLAIRALMEENTKLRETLRELIKAVKESSDTTNDKKG